MNRRRYGDSRGGLEVDRELRHISTRCIVSQVARGGARDHEDVTLGTWTIEGHKRVYHKITLIRVAIAGHGRKGGVQLTEQVSSFSRSKPRFS